MGLQNLSKEGLSSNQRFLDYSAPKGYDPLALQREVKRAMGIVSSILEEKWEKEKPGSQSS